MNTSLLQLLSILISFIAAIIFAYPALSGTKLFSMEDDRQQDKTNEKDKKKNQYRYTTGRIQQEQRLAFLGLFLLSASILLQIIAISGCI